MKEVICEIVPGLTLNGVVVSEFYHPVSNLVRCKDCKHQDDLRYEVGGKFVCRKGYGLHPDDFYCADGERK